MPGDDLIKFADEIKEQVEIRGSWNILIVDDEAQVHEITKMALQDFVYANKELHFTSAYSAKEAIALLQERDDFSIVLLDLIMENDKAGLDVVEFIRNSLKNRLIRIIIRSGEHAQKSQRYIVDNYDINNYTEKQELTVDKFYTSVRTALVQYEQISELNQTKNELMELNSSLQAQIDAALEVQKKADQEAFHNSRILQMNELLNMLAHQWRQPLTRISSIVANVRLHLALETYSLDTLDHDMESVDEHIQGLSKIIDTFRQFYKVDNEKSLKHIDQMILETVDIMAPLFESDAIAITLDVEQNLHACSTEIAQVFLNIMKNAYEEFVDNKIEMGRVKIEAKNMEKGIRIVFEDNAGGISDEIIGKVFDPYFSTKLKKHGIGLGLFSCKMIIEERCNGEIWVENIDGGSRFTITLPHPLLD